MNIPESIPFSSVILTDRGRTTYSGIDGLAQSILDNGLIQPIVLTPWHDELQHLYYLLVAGGRRFTALAALGTEILYHGTTSDPARPGFLIQGEAADPFRRLMTEIAENLDRENLNWRDEMALIVKAYKLAKADANSRGIEILMRDFGATLGVGYHNLQAAVAISEDVAQHPERYKDITGIRGAYAKLLKANEIELIKLQATKSLEATPLLGTRPSTVEAQIGLEPIEGLTPDAPIIPLTQAFFCQNGLDFMASVPEGSFDHIVTDPDYAVSAERLGANMANADAGIIQDTITDSLDDLRRFLVLAHRATKPTAFCVFFYDLDHHEKLQTAAVAAGWLVQRWPLTWKKLDYRSNAAPAHNFCKNEEWAMVCRKPGSVLSRPQMTSVFDAASAQTTKVLNHPFAKPGDLWKWIYAAISIKGQVVLDPFCGSGSACIAAAEYGLRPVGCELNENHYPSLLLNMQAAYRKILGNNVRFT